jgi:integrase/recombinase XerD
MENIPLDPKLETLLQEYHHHCRAVLGLASHSCSLRLLRARSFLSDLSVRGPVVPGRLSASSVLDYLTGASARVSETALPNLLSGVRCFLRFLHVGGFIPLALEQVLPPVAHPATVPPPKYLSSNQVGKLLRALDRRSPLGRRDYALVLGLVRLGLRAGEIAGLKLQDVDWDQGTLSVRQTKKRRATLMPLPQAVGQAWVAYLRRGRPPTVLRQVFVSAHRPPQVMTSNSVTKVVSRALARAGLPWRGAHVLRHTLATHLVQKGASLKAVADLLGHQQLQTTGLYAKVNRPMLAEVAQPWPEVQL